MQGMRWVAVLCTVGACIRQDPPVACGVRICSPGSVCLPDGTCAIPPESPTHFMFDNRASNTDLVDTPLLVTLDASTIDYAQVQDPSRDLGFRTADSDQDLPFEVERWNPQGESLVWTLLPRVAAASNNDALVMHFGPGANRLAAPASMVWQNYELVVHGTKDFESSAAPTYPADAGAITRAPAAIGDGVAFSGVADSMLMFDNSGALFDGWSQFSFGFWLYADYSGALPPEPRVVHKDAGGSVANGRLFQYNGIDDVYAFQIDLNFAAATSWENFFIAPRSWTYITYTYDGQVLRIFRDGTLAAFFRNASVSPLKNDSSNLVLGDSVSALRGLLDEIRVTKRTLTPNEVRADYLVQSRQVLHAR